MVKGVLDASTPAPVKDASRTCPIFTVNCEDAALTAQAALTTEPVNLIVPPVTGVTALAMPQDIAKATPQNAEIPLFITDFHPLLIVIKGVILPLDMSADTNVV